MQSGRQSRDVSKMMRNGASDEKAFIFLYPQPEIINFEIKRCCFGCLEILNPGLRKTLNEKYKDAESKSEKDSARREILRAMLTECRSWYKRTLNTA